MIESLRLAQLQKLIAALYLENYSNFQNYLSFEQGKLNIGLNDHSSIQIPCTMQGIMMPYRVTQHYGNQINHTNNEVKKCSLEVIFKCLCTASWWPNTKNEKATTSWLSALDTLTVLADNSKNTLDFEQQGEWFALLIDRPNHPFAHAKAQLVDVLKTQFIAPQRVQWWAFEKSRVFTCNKSNVLDIMLSVDEKAEIESQMASFKGEHIALPLLASEEAQAVKLGSAQSLNTTSLLGMATSSLRTFYHLENEKIHIKLATQANPLGAMRTMPPRYLYNGDCAYQLLQQILQRCDWLADHIALCDERHWWAVGHSNDMLECRGEIGVQIRNLPTQTGVFRCSMAAFNHPETWYLLAEKGFDPAHLFKEIVNTFVTALLRLFSYGVMPECHGQNLLVDIQHDSSVRLVLRDHDTLRICPQQLSTQQLPLPDYQINWHTPNTLVLKDLATLLSYFTTLGIQVNLYPIAQALETAGYIDESSFWYQLYHSLNYVVDDLEEGEIKAVIKADVIHTELWPFKAILDPLFTASEGGTGMPSSMKQVANPFYLLAIGERSESA